MVDFNTSYWMSVPAVVFGGEKMEKVKEFKYL